EDPRSGGGRGRTCTPARRATSRGASRRRAPRRRARRSTRAPARASSLDAQNALSRDEGREDREDALPPPATRLEREPPEPFEADRVDESGRQPYAAGQLIEDAPDADRRPNGRKEGQVPGDPTLLGRHAVGNK